MNTNTKTIFLTLVLVFFGSVGMAQTDELSTQLCSKEESQSYNQQIKVLQEKLRNVGKLKETEVKSLEEQLRQARADAKACVDGASAMTQNKNTLCKELKDEMNKITEKFPIAAQRRALTCMGEEHEVESSPDIKKAIARGLGVSETAFSSERPEQNKICRSSAPKSDFSERYEKMTKDIEEYEEKIEKLKDKIIDSERDAEKELKSLENDRLDLRKDFEELKKKQKISESEALNAKREAQLKLENSIREAKTKLKDLKTQKANSTKDRNDQLLAADVINFSSMRFTCTTVVNKYCSENPKACAKSTSKGLGQLSQKGNQKVESINKVVFNNCLKKEDSKRASIYRNFQQREEKIIDEIADAESVISTLQNQLSISVEEYNKAVQESRSELSQAEIDYNLRDLQLAKSITQQTQINAKEKSKLEEQIDLIGRKIISSRNSMGEINDDEAEELLRSGIKYADAMENHAKEGCFGAATDSDREVWKGYKKEYEAAIQQK